MAVKVKEDLTNKQFGNWVVLEELGGGKVKCECQCKDKTVKILYKKAVKNGQTKSCGCLRAEFCEKTKRKNGVYNERHTKYEGQRFGELTVVGKSEKDGKVLCTCDCSPNIIREFWISHLVNGATKSCGHNRFNDLTNKQFGNWIVKEELSDGKVIVQCQCESKTIKKIFKSSLLNGKSKSCGCKRTENCQNTMIERYGDICTLKVENPREDWQIEVVNNAEAFKEFLIDLGYKPTLKDLSELLSINKSSVAKTVRKYNMEDYVDLLQAESYAEIELTKYIKSIYTGRIVRRDKSVINPLEIDIYLPDLKLGIEFNGTYWHSTEFKDKNYHRNKSVIALNNGVRLIHIFEYEWEDELTKKKILYLIKSLISNENNRIYARNCKIKIVSSEDTKIFINQNHMQGYTNSSINIGLYYTDELVMIMTFDKSRFNNDAEYEIIRLCSKLETKVIGGASKIFKHFINTYNPNSVVAYSDLTKFTGGVYSEIGFKVKELTSPNYVWCDGYSKLTRYQTMKKKLIEKGLGTEDQTEDEIMYNLGYFKIYNSGNIKYLWEGDK